MRRLLLLSILAAALAAPAAAEAASRPATGISPARGFAPREVVVKLHGQRSGLALRLPRGTGVRGAVAALRRNPRVDYAEPNYIATAAAAAPAPLPEVPNDPGTLGGASGASAAAGGWTQKQWNFLPWQGRPTARLPVSPGGIDALGAWRNLEAAGRPGAVGVTVAVLDTGIAYRSRGRAFRRSPDFGPRQFARGYDFVDDDRVPLDENGHGTHIAGTIAEKTGNGIALTGLAYRARLMPIRVLDAQGRGKATAIAEGIRYAVGRGADVINMSFNFGCRKPVSVVDEALREAFEKGVIAVASAGNKGSEACVAEPATGPRVIGVGGTTEGACLGSYSLSGRAIDLLAPGGGEPAPGCLSVAARPIYQVTLKPGTTDVFAIPGNYMGTSMAAAHVSGVAAMVLASGVLGGRAEAQPKARVAMMTRRLRASARDLGLSRAQQGGGLLDAGAATAPRSASRSARS